jgi:outer membrane protein
LLRSFEGEPRFEPAGYGPEIRSRGWQNKFRERDLNIEILKTRRNKVNSRITTASRFRGQLMRAALLAGAALFATVGAHAQAAPAAGSATTGKTGVINIRQAIASTAEGKQASAELQSQFSARQNELEGMNKQINDIRQRLDTGAGKLNPDEATRLQRQGESMARQLQRKQDEYQEDVQSAQADVFDRIGRKMVDVLDRYARENGIVVVLDSSAQNTPVLFVSPNIDITQEIVRLYDNSYPVKAGAATAPARPATGGTTTPKPAAAPKPQQ